MKTKRLFLLLVTSFLLTGCSLPNNSSSSSGASGDSSQSGGGSSGGGTTSEDPTVEPADSIQDMNILHAWNWKLSDVQSRLSMIKQAGYGAVQISPMQPKVDGNGWSNQSTKSQWWKLYQPVGLKVAENDETFLGTKTELTSLCAAAKTQGIKIVVDIVTNHLSTDRGQWKGSYATHNFSSSISYNSRESIVKGDMGGLPDLDTHNSSIQTAALNMLKSYIDCGVSGFRFDAAKHIETPDDNDSYKSNFWTTVLDGTTSYAKGKGLDDPYYYGEILNNPGPGASFTYYTKMMSTCDNEQADDVMDSIVNSSTTKLTSAYNSGVNGDHLVLWAESHDTYANDRDSAYRISRDYSVDKVNKAYMIQASRKDAATLYFARPSTDTGDSALNVTICTVNNGSGWRNNEVAAINKFHARYVGKSESVSIKDNKYFVNVRGSGSFAGAAIVNVNGSNTATIDVGLQDGTYKDLISNNTYSVSNGSVNVTFRNGGCILVPDDGGGQPQVTYDSNVVLQNADSSKFYYAWLFGKSSGDKWVKFTTDHDALGINVEDYPKYIIVEMRSDTPSWDNKNWQTDDIVYSGSQDIYDCTNIPKKSS